MSEIMDGAWFLPSRKRPDAARKFFDAYAATKASTPGLLIVDRDDAWQYKDVALPSGWRLREVKGGCFVDAMVEAYEGVKDRARWIGWLQDDTIPETPEWDKRLLSHLLGWNVVNSNDGWQANADVNRGRMHGAVAWSGDLVRAVGYLFPPGFKHMFTEAVWETLGRSTGCWQTDMSVMVRHEHAVLSGNNDDTRQHTLSFMDRDQAVYREWLQVEKGVAVERILTLMEEYGSKIALPDLSAYRLMLATPSYQRLYTQSFMKSWHWTIGLLEDCRATVTWAEVPHVADPALARAKLLGTFFRSTCTHMLMIDDDMGWNPHDVIRLLRSGKDCIGGAGPMKKYPLQFAMNFPSTGFLAEGSGEFEVEKVGGAFLMLSRDCVRRMIAAYPDLEFVLDENQPSDYALFDPVYVMAGGQRWRFSEDYSFCWRWRQIGGKVYIFPDIRLEHTGQHTFAGSFMDLITIRHARDGIT